MLAPYLHRVTVLSSFLSLSFMNSSVISGQKLPFENSGGGAGQYNVVGAKGERIIAARHYSEVTACSNSLRRNLITTNSWKFDRI